MNSSKVVYLASRQEVASQTEIAAFFKLKGGEVRFKLFGAGGSVAERAQVAEAFEAAAESIRMGFAE